MIYKAQSIDNGLTYLYNIRCQRNRKDCGMKKHIAIYGATQIKRGYCSECQGYAFIIDKTLQCCFAEEGKEKASNYHRVIQSEGIKRSPPKIIQEEILKRQNRKCIYCDIKFGEIYFRKGKPNISRINYDHLVPFSYLNNNPYNNWVASCNVCNSIKGSKMFETIEEVKTYVNHTRRKKEIYYSKELR